MRYLLGEMSNGTKKLLAARARGWGRVFVDGLAGNTFPLPGEPWALDNGAFRGWRASPRFPAPATPADVAPFLNRFHWKLDAAAELARAGHPPLFVVAPDLPANPESLAFTIRWLDANAHRWPELADRWAFVLNDGATPELLEPIVGRFGTLFLGGSDAWKETAPFWSRFSYTHGLRFHYGRATKSRLSAAIAAGADSADSSHPLRLGADRWAGFLAAWDNRNLDLWEAA